MFTKNFELTAPDADKLAAPFYPGHYKVTSETTVVASWANGKESTGTLAADGNSVKWTGGTTTTWLRSPASIKMRADQEKAKQELMEVLKAQIGFNPDKSTLTAAGAKVVDSVAAVLLKFPAVGVTIHGHSGGTNSPALLKLSLDRSDTVAGALRSKGCTNTMVTKGWGPAHPTVGAKMLVRIEP